MILYKILIINIYKFLVFLNGGTLYNDSKEAKLHTYLVFTVLNTMIFFSIVSLLYFKIKGEPYSGLVIYIIPIIFFYINYVVMYKKKIFESIFLTKLISFNLVHVIMTIIYVGITIYFMFLIGNHINAYVISHKS